MAQVRLPAPQNQNPHRRPRCRRRRRRRRPQEALSFPVEGDGSKQWLAFTLPCATDRAGSLWTVFTAEPQPQTPGPPSQVRQYSPGGRLLNAFGSFGAGPGQLQYPAGIDVSRAGHVYVAGARGAAPLWWLAAGRWRWGAAPLP